MAENVKNTNIEENLDSVLQQLKEETHFLHSDSKEYTRIITSLNNLTGLIREKKAADEHGAIKPFKTEDLLEVQERYRNALDACNTYLSARSSSRSTRMGAGRVYITEKIKALLTQDMKDFAALNLENDITLEDAFQKIRTEYVTVDGKNIKHHGANMSTRIPLTYTDSNGIKREGFFTEEETFNINKDISDMFHKLEKKYNDPEYRKYLSKLKQITDKEFLLNSDDIPSLADIMNANRYKHYTPFRMFHALKNHMDLPNMDKHKDFLHDVGTSLSSLQNKESILVHSAKVNEGTTLSKRNVAMSKVADLLGVSNILAKSTAMTVFVDGKAVHGVFMEKAEGSDINRLKENDPLFSFDQKDLKSNDIRKQISDIQILDYICGNVDRHMGNMLYKFETVDGRKKLCGIIGIDNDTSFGSIAPKSNESPMQLTALDNMRVISKSTADRVMGLDANTLELHLQGIGLHEKEIEKAKQRLSNMQEKIKEGAHYFDSNRRYKNNPSQLKHRYIRIIDDDKFSLLADKDLAYINTQSYKGNLFAKMHYIGAKKGEATFDNDIEMTGGTLQQAEMSSEVTITPNAFITLTGRLSSIKQDLQNTESFFHKDSGEYKLMSEALDKIAKAGKTMHDAHPFGDISEAEAKTLSGLYKDLGSAVQIYIDRKNNPSSSLGKNRLELAKELLALTKDSQTMFTVQQSFKPNAPVTNPVQAVLLDSKDQPVKKAAATEKRTATSLKELESSLKSSTEQKNKLSKSVIQPARKEIPAAGPKSFGAMSKK